MDSIHEILDALHTASSTNEHGLLECFRRGTDVLEAVEDCAFSVYEREDATILAARNQIAAGAEPGSLIARTACTSMRYDLLWIDGECSSRLPNGDSCRLQGDPRYTGLGRGRRIASNGGNSERLLNKGDDIHRLPASLLVEQPDEVFYCLEVLGSQPNCSEPMLFRFVLAIKAVQSRSHI
jgi:hypothetical protein